MRIIITTVLSIALISLLLGTGTFAYLSDAEVSDANSLQAGTMDLYLTDNGDVDHEWSMARMIPGQAIKSGHLRLRNIGSIEADHVQASFNSDCTVPGMDAYLKVASMYYTNSDNIAMYVVIDGHAVPLPPETVINQLGAPVPAIEDSNLNGYIDLQDLHGVTLDNLEAPVANSDSSSTTDHCDFNMEIRFDIEAPNQYQGEECILNVEFTLNQEEYQ